MNSKIILIPVLTALLVGCATTPLSYHRYSSTENLQSQAMAEGVVVRTMPIHISNSQAGTANGTLGGLAGGVAGYALGGNAIGAIAGLVGGAIIGNTVTPGSVSGTEVMVKLTDGQLLGVPEVGNPGLHPGEQVAILRGADGNTRAVPLH
ncbi:outer membrane lipoprotein [Acidithiobacillus sp.]